MTTRTDPMLLVLNLAQTLAAPFLLIKKWRRFRARGDAYEWDLARWNPQINLADESGKKHLVFVSVGFAETRLVARLSELLQQTNPELRITWAVRNLDAAREGGAIPDGQAVVPLPFDYFWPVNVWHRRVAPDIVVFIERCNFPNLVRGLKNRGVKVAGVAVRTRDHRGGRYRWGALYQRWLWGAFDLLCLRSEEELLKLRDSVPTSTNVEVTGSLKFWPELPPLNAKQHESLKSWLEQIGGRPVLAAGSTQPGDEEWIIEAFAPLREQFQTVLLLAPRHVNRASEVEAQIVNFGWKVARRSLGEQTTEKRAAEKVDVLLLDTLGELTHAYAAAEAVFIGGTIQGTGHNVLEPIAHGVPVFFGPKRGTFSAEQEMCEEAGAGFRVQTPLELTQGWERAITNQEWRSQVRDNALSLNSRGAQAWQQTVDAIQELVNTLD